MSETKLSATHSAAATTLEVHAPKVHFSEKELAAFDEIRPFNDDEVQPCIERLLADDEFIDSIAYLKLPKMLRFSRSLLRGLVRKRLANELANTRSVKDFQTLIEGYLKEVIDSSISRLSVSGLENLNNERAHLFISNHRDITMDPACVNWTLYQAGFSTLRIAIGDNLLTKPFASDLMRLNKSFIVNRSAKSPREKLKVAKTLSSYIRHSILNDNENVWLAQREGRAKDGIDVTNPAIVSMLVLCKNKTQSLAEFVRDANIVPVTISYEYDPCDARKARELYAKNKYGEYQKEQHEDVESIALGITGYKGNVHLAFGKPLSGEFEAAEDIVTELDQRINNNYVLHLSNCLAYELLEKKSPKVPVSADLIPFDSRNWHHEREKFAAHLETCPQKYREILLQTYANPVYRKLNATSQNIHAE